MTPGGDRKACVYLKTEPSPPPPMPLEEEEAVSTGSGRRLEQMCAENEAVTVTFTIEVETTTATGSLMEAIVEAEEADVDEGGSVACVAPTVAGEELKIIPGPASPP